MHSPSRVAMDPTPDPRPDARPRTPPAAPDRPSSWALTAEELDASRGTLRQLVRERLTRMVLTGALPAQERLGEEGLAQALGVSRTPVREALARLHAERLVDRYADGGYHVAELDLDGLRDLYELRTTLELRGLTRALEGFAPPDPAVLEPLRDRWRALQRDLPAPDPTFVEVDESFHVALSRASGNHALADTLETVNHRIRPVRMHDFLTADRIEATAAEHLGVVEAVLAGDVPTAVERLRVHVGESMAVVERRAARAITYRALRRRPR